MYFVKKFPCHPLTANPDDTTPETATATENLTRHYHLDVVMQTMRCAGVYVAR